MGSEQVSDINGSRRSVSPWIVIIVVLTGVVSGVAGGTPDTSATPEVTITTETDPPDGFDASEIDEIARTQPFRVGCNYGNLLDGTEYTLRLVTSPGDFTVVQDSRPVLTFRNTVSGDDGTRWYTVTPSDSFDESEVKVRCELYEYRAEVASGGASSATPPVDSYQTTLDVRPTTVYTAPRIDGLADEGEETYVGYYGWTTESARVRLLAERDGGWVEVDSGSLDGRSGRLAVDPTDYLDIERSQSLPLRLVSTVRENFVSTNTRISSGSVDVNTVPRASISPPSEETYSVGEDVTLFAEAVDYDDGPEIGDGIGRYVWTVNDVAELRGREVVYAFEEPGTYEVTLAVWDDEGLTATASRSIEVTNEAPSVTIGLSPGDEVHVYETLELTARADDREDMALEYVWDFGDGSEGFGAVVTHEYDQARAYEVTLLVRDELDAETATRKRITVTNEAPTAAIALSTGSEVVVDEGIRLTARADDREGMALVYTWDFGDEREGDGEVVDHAYDEPGTYEVALVVRDELGARTEAHRTITVRNERPRIADGYPTRGPNPDEDVLRGRSVRFSARAHDPDGGPVTYTWNFGDGGQVTGDEVVHSFRNAGTYPVTLTVTDDEGGATVARIEVPVRRPTLLDRLQALTLEETVAVAGLGLAILTPLLKMGYDYASRRRKESS